ncbi:MAG: hypothetical protein ACXW5U_15845 [Thermoanaerobaculia bacterium]
MDVGIEGSLDLLNITWGTSLAGELEVDGSVAESENSISVTSPVFWRWVSPKAGATITGFGPTVTPTFGTDRAFDREVWEVAVKANMRSPAFLRMGLISNVKNRQEGRDLLGLVATDAPVRNG